MTKKISFDFDGTLSENYIQELAHFLKHVAELWVCTSRAPGKQNDKDLKPIVQSLNIPAERILYTDGGMKWSMLNHYGIDIHFDDMEDEIVEINNRDGCKGLLVGLKDPNELWYLFQNRTNP